MAQTPEGRVKDAVKKMLKARKIWFFMPMQNGMGVVGIPDFICCKDGRFFGVETKAPGRRNNLSVNQRARKAEIERAGGYVFVVDSVELLQDMMDEVGL